MANWTARLRQRFGRTLGENASRVRFLRAQPRACVDRDRAARFGIEGKLIDFGKKEEVPLPSLMGELLAYVVTHEVGHSLGFPHNFKTIYVQD